MIERAKIGGVILAGGKASRMGNRDKALQLLDDRPLLSHVIDRASPQLQVLLLSVNHNAESYASFDLPIVSDHTSGYGGPLLGIHSAMHWFNANQSETGIEYLACFPADVPDFPSDVVRELARPFESNPCDVTFIRHRKQIQPLFSLWRLELIEKVRSAIDSGLYGPKLLFDSMRAISVQNDSTSPGLFFNINSIEELEQARGKHR